MTADESRMPSYALLSSEKLKFYKACTDDGLFNLSSAEQWWRDRWENLFSKGYILRPRYRPGWRPSWIGTRVDPTFCEDSLMLLEPHVIDATQRETSALVSIKRVSKNLSEIDLARALTTSELLRNRMNHCVPILDCFSDPIEPETRLLVMPFLCPFDDPPFGAVGEVVDFFQQTLEGLCFLHDQGVAHRDCAAANIMMDGAPLYPRGHHPVRLDFSPDAVHMLQPLARIDHPVRYHFIDFGISTCFPPGVQPFVTGAKGRDKELPELSARVPYDAFRADIFILGNVYKKDFLQKYHGLDFLSPLVNAMTGGIASQRPSIHSALTKFTEICLQLNSSSLRWRLRARDESVPQRVMYDTVAVARETIYQLKRVVGQTMGVATPPSPIS